MRGNRPFSFFRPPAFPYHHRLPGRHFFQDLEEPLSVLHSLQVHTDNFNLLALTEVGKVIGGIEHYSVAEAYGFVYIQSLEVCLMVEADSVGAALRDKTHRPGRAGILHSVTLPDADARVENSHAVRTDEVEARCGCFPGEQAFQLYPFFGIGLGKAGGKEMGGSHFFTNKVI